MNDIQTILVEADEQTRIRLRLNLRSQPGIEVASEATNGKTGLVLLESIDVDVAVVSANLPDLTVADFLRQMIELQLDSAVRPSKVLVLLDSLEPQSLERAMVAAANGYCLKRRSPEAIAAAIRQIYAGERYLDAAIAASLVMLSAQASGL